MPNFNSFVYDMAVCFKPDVVNGFCYGKFRPAACYSTTVAPFGFDWVRTGDATAYTEVDIPYKNNMGYYVESDASLLRCLVKTEVDDFTPTLAMYHKLCHSYLPGNLRLFPSERGKFTRYHVPVLSLYLYNDEPDNVAHITLEVEIKEEMRDIYLEYDSFLLEIDGVDSLTVSRGKQTCELLIKCIKEFDTDEYIKLIAIDNRGRAMNAGMLRVVPNAKRFRRSVNILFVNVKHTLSNKATATVLCGRASDDKENIQKLFKHAFIKPTFDTFDWDLQYEFHVASRMVKAFGRDVVIVYNESPGKNANPLAFPQLVDLVDYLAKKLEKIKDVTSYHAVVFCMGCLLVKEKNLHFTLLSGHGSGKYAMLKDNYESATAIHEILHTLDLPHTFDNYLLDNNTFSPYIYRMHTTDNIMDYSHMVGYSRTKLWEWQWKLIRLKCKPEI